MNMANLMRLAMVMLLSACTTFVPMSPRASLGQSRLELHFATPIELVGQRQDGERVVRKQVRWVAGRPLGVRNDSLVLEVERWSGIDRWQRESRPFIAVIRTADSCTDVGTRHFSGGRTTAFILSVPVVAWVLLWILCDRRLHARRVGHGDLTREGARPRHVGGGVGSGGRSGPRSRDRRSAVPDICGRAHDAV
jgi:hypothetical protein